MPLRFCRARTKNERKSRLEERTRVGLFRVEMKALGVVAIK